MSLFHAMWASRLHGNVFDVVAWDGKLIPLGTYLAENLLGETKDIVVVFNLSSGGTLEHRTG